MFIPIKELLILAIGCVFLVIWLLLFVSGKKYEGIFVNLDEKQYPLKDLYSTGCALLYLMKYDFRKKRDRKLRQEIEILYGKKYIEFYLRVIYSRALTYGMLLFIAGFILYGFSGEITILFIMALYSGLAVYYFMTITNRQIQKRSEELLRDFSVVISQLALLTNAGMILREAWEVVARSGNSDLYNEMQISVDDMRNGISEIEAIRRFGIRCMIPEVKKFSATIIQGMQKGNKELSDMLQSQSAEVWTIRKHQVRRQGEKSASKLLIPIFIMFFGIIIMVIVPIFANLGTM